MKVCPTCNSQWPDETRFCPNDGSTLRSAAGASDLVGNVIADRYHIVKKLGEGGMGAVYLGEHVKMGRKSAIKVMSQSMANDADAIARFNREAANAARITHPNVCAIYDFGETPEGLIYLAMEFIEGNSLTSIMEKDGALPAARAARILSQTGEALQAAHDLGIVHRDLKPDNIMITRARDGADVVKVVDFGIAKAMSGDEGQKVTKTGLVVGTPEYMSPEQLSGDKLDGRSDIYSLALVFFRMVTGVLPFQADSAQETMIKRLTDDPLKLAEAMPGSGFPARLQQIMDRGLARMPAERYANAAEFARDVVKVVDSMRGAPAVDEGATQMIDAQDANTALIATTRITGSKPGDRTPMRTTPHTPVPPAALARPVEKKNPVVLIAAVVGVLVVGGSAAAVMLRNGPESGARKPADSSVTDTTATGARLSNNAASNPASDGTRPLSAGKTATQPDTVTQRQVVESNSSGGVSPAPYSTADSIRIHQELGSILDDLGDPAKLASARKRATDIYLNERILPAQRAEAAVDVSIAHEDQGNNAEACRWLGLALTLRPGWSLALQNRRRLACP